MSESPTPKQAMILWGLLGRQGSALQGEIVPKVEKADREALVAERYLLVDKQGRSLMLTVTDKGWDWAGRHLLAPLPTPFRVLQDWLERIDGHLAATGTTLADLIGTPPVSPVGPAPERKSRSAKAPPPRQRKPKAASPGRTAKRSTSPTPPDLRARIEAAYLSLTGGRKAEAVRLSALRRELADLGRAAVDAGLAAILRGDPTARLSQFSDPRSLDAAERAAAFSPAGEPFHIIRIQS